VLHLVHLQGILILHAQGVENKKEKRRWLIQMSSDNFYVIRKHPKGGFTYVMGSASHDLDDDETFNIDLPVSKNSSVFKTFDEAMDSALGLWAEYGVFTHPECEEDQSGVKKWEGTD